MDFQEAAQLYANWCQQLTDNRISPAEFAALLDRLPFQDAQGQWWRIEHPSGAWLCWNGQAWEFRSPPDNEMPSRPRSTATLAQGSQQPQSLLQLIGWLARSVLKAIPQQLLLGLLIAITIWLLHLVLLVGVNDGFNITGKNPWFDSLLVLGTEVVSGSLFWVFTGILVSKLFQGSLASEFKATASLPLALTQFWQRSSQSKAPLAWLGLSVSLLFNLFFANLLVSIQILFFTLVALRESHHFLRLFVDVSWHDLQMLLRPGRSPRSLVPDQVQQLLSGSVVGCSLAALLFWLAPAFFPAVCFVAIAIAGWQLYDRHPPIPPLLPLGIFLIFSGSLIAGDIQPVWADDGGWSECGRSLATWLQCGGTDQAIANSGLAGLGAWIGWILGGLQIPLDWTSTPPVKIYGKGTPDDPFRDYLDASNPPWMQGVRGDGSSEHPFTNWGVPDTLDEPSGPAQQGDQTSPSSNAQDANTGPTPGDGPLIDSVGRTYYEGKTYTFDDGREYQLKDGRLVPTRELSDGEVYVNPDGDRKIWKGGQSWQENDWKQQEDINRRYSEDSRARNDELARTGQDAQSQALQKIANKYIQDRLALTAQAQKNKADLREFFDKLHQSDYINLASSHAQLDIMNKLTSGLEWIKWGCDKSIDVLEKVTGPPGKVVRNTYTVLSGTAGGLGEGMAHGDVAWGTLKGTGKGLVDLGVRLGVEQPLTGWLGNTRQIPGFRDIKPGKDSMGYKQYVYDVFKAKGFGQNVGDVTVKDVIGAYRGSPDIDKFLSGHIQAHVNHALINSLMREARNRTVYRPLTWTKDQLKSILGL